MAGSQLGDYINSLKGIFKGGQSSIVGLDIGLSAIKVCESTRNSSGEIKITKYASVPLPDGVLIEDEIQNKQIILESIKEAFKKAKISSDTVAIGMSGSNTVARRLQLAGGSADEISSQVEWEAEQYIPFGVDESYMSYHVFGENEGGGVDVLLAGSRKAVIEEFKEVVQEAGYNVKIVDLDILAATNVFEHVLFDEMGDGGSYILIDFGAQKTNFIIYKNGAISFNKEMNIGGLMITEEIQRQMGVTFHEAEDLKVTGDEQGNLPEEILDIINDVSETFFTEIKKTYEFYITSTSDENIKACYVTGGAAKTPNLLDGLETLLDIKVTFFNPFNGIDYDKKSFDDIELENIATRGVVAIGLSMRS